jgi:hypothetical protein
LLLLVQQDNAALHAVGWYDDFSFLFFSSIVVCIQFSNYLFHLFQILHESIYQTFLDQLVEVYKQVRIGDPLEKGTLLGALHTPTSKENFLKGVQTIKSQVKL